MSLNGRAQVIYERASALAARMIAAIVESEPTPVPQTGVPTLFKRRRPEESEIPPLESAARVYDFIRMLDADGYPRAFIERAGWRYEFRNASLDEQDGDAVVVADVRVSRTGGGGS